MLAPGLGLALMAAAAGITAHVTGAWNPFGFVSRLTVLVAVLVPAIVVAVPSILAYRRMRRRVLSEWREHHRAHVSDVHLAATERRVP